MNETKTYHHLPCNETPDNCNFLLRSFRKGETFSNTDKGMNYIVFCQKGEVRLTSSLFRKEMLHGGDILFLPRMADCQGEILEDTHAVIHTFNNTVCRPENCILNYLYTHKKKEEGGNPTTERQRRKIYALCEALGWNDDPRRIQGFVKRVAHVDRIEWLNMAQCEKVIEGLKAILARQRRKEAEL